MFNAPLGFGKTLGATIIAKHYQQESGCALYSNFGLVGSKPFTDIEDFKKIAQEHSSILVLDEAHLDLDARSFSTNHVKFFTQVSYYLRKLRCTLIMTSPNFSDLDTRIRGITNIVFDVTKDRKNFYYDVYDIQRRRHVKTIKISKENAFKIGDLYFDTYKMVTPIQIPKQRDDFTSFLEELKVIAETYHIERRLGALPTTEVIGGNNLVHS